MVDLHRIECRVEKKKAIKKSLNVWQNKNEPKIKHIMNPRSAYPWCKIRPHCCLDSKHYTGCTLYWGEGEEEIRQDGRKRRERGRDLIFCYELHCFHCACKDFCSYRNTITDNKDFEKSTLLMLLCPYRLHCVRQTDRTTSLVFTLNKW